MSNSKPNYAMSSSYSGVFSTFFSNKDLHNLGVSGVMQYPQQ